MKILATCILLLMGIGTVPADNVLIRFKAPTGYSRSVSNATSFGNWLGHLPLKTVGSRTHTYTGDIARTDAYTAAVIDMSIGNQDLQQCADAVMRLRAEYLFHQKQYNAIAFNLTSGFRCDYLHYADGYRFVSDKWVLKVAKDYSYPTFIRYMNLVFSYAGTLSLEKELVKVNDAG